MTGKSGLWKRSTVLSQIDGDWRLVEKLKKQLENFCVGRLRDAARVWQTWTPHRADFLHRSRTKAASVGEPAEPRQMQQRLADEYARGYMSGWEECFEACLNALHCDSIRSEQELYRQ
jgi:hypothetical protein